MELASGPTTTGDLAGLWRVDSLCDAAAGPPHPASCLRPGVRSATGAAVAGIDGFLFIGDGANRWEEQYLWSQPLADRWLASWRRILEQRQSQARARGAVLWNLVIPEKQVLHADKRWPQETSAGEQRPWRQLERTLSPDLQVVYGAEALRSLEGKAPAYFRHNSHCTPSGCCALAQAVLDAMRLPVSLAAQPLTYVQDVRAHDLTVHFFDPAPQEDYAWLHPAGEVVFDNQAFERTGRYTGSSYGVRNPAAPDPRRAIVFGDSYSYDVGLTFALSAVFAETVFVWSKALDWAAVDRHQSQVIVWESAERFINSLPEA